MSDAVEISSLVARMNFATDSYSTDHLREVWAQDANISFTAEDDSQGELHGLDAIISAMEASWATGPMERHIMSNPDIQVIGNEGIVHYYALYSMVGPQPVSTGFGEFFVKVRKDDSGRWWVIEQRGKQHSRPDGVASRGDVHKQGGLS